MVIRISDKTQNYSKVTKLLVKPLNNYIFDKRISIEVLFFISSKKEMIFHLLNYDIKNMYCNIEIN